MSLSEKLQALATEKGHPLDSIEFAKAMDKDDELAKYKEEFAFPARRDVSGENPVIGTENEALYYLWAITQILEQRMNPS